MANGFKKIYIIPLLVAAVIIGAVYSVGNRGTPSPGDDEWQTFESPSAVLEETPAPAAHEETLVPEADGLIKVYITGEVVNPDVYELETGSRVVDVLRLAGGATSDAALENINLSVKLADEDHIIVPKIGQAEPQEIERVAVKAASETSGKTTITDSRVNINTATSSQLQTLPGIGEVTAGKIIAYRNANGAFERIEDIKNVDRIGEKTFQALEDLIKVE